MAEERLAPHVRGGTPVPLSRSDMGPLGLSELIRGRNIAEGMGGVGAEG